jgi:26S proteasome regulatory subunit N10
MEEEQARQAAAQPPAATPAPATSSAPETIPADPTDDEEEAMLKQALAMSEGADDVNMEGEEDDEEMSEEDAINRAIQMSMKPDDEKKS